MCVCVCTVHHSFHSTPLHARNTQQHAKHAGRLPIDPEFGKAVGEGVDFMQAQQGTQTHAAVMAVVTRLTGSGVSQQAQGTGMDQTQEE